jgi:uncharacterized membrane protein (UPF0127 family)
MRSSISFKTQTFMATLALVLLPAAALAKAPIAEIGKNKIKLEVAETQKQIEHGLMFRASMPEDQGMVFLFRPTRNVRFWMFNCLMSLDMMFIKDGKIVKISRDVPPCKSHKPEECPLYPSEGEVEASEVLEVNAGYCKSHGIAEGDNVKFSLGGVSASAASSKKEPAEPATEAPVEQAK